MVKVLKSFDHLYNKPITQQPIKPHLWTSYIYQLLAIVNVIYEAYDANSSLEVRSVLLDLFETFDRVWHEKLMYNLKRLGIWVNISNLHSFLSKSRKV